MCGFGFTEPAKAKGEYLFGRVLARFFGKNVMENRVCVFVDGENLRFAVKGLFHPQFFNEKEYLPIKARWDEWFDNIAKCALPNSNARRIRTYWYVIEKVRCFPPLIYSKMDYENKKTWVQKNMKYFSESERQILEDENNADWSKVLDQMTGDLQGRKGHIKNMFQSNQHKQNLIAKDNKAIEFCRSGEIQYNLHRGQFGQEKTVDVNLSLGMVLKAPIYDTAIIVSGDQDYVPAVQQVKNLGKHVINVSFQKVDGELLPGGARRLNEITDWSLEISFSDLQIALGLTEQIES